MDAAGKVVTRPRSDVTTISADAFKKYTEGCNSS